MSDLTPFGKVFMVSLSLAIVFMALAGIFWMWGLDVRGPVTSAVTLAVIAVVSMLWGWAIGDDT